MGFVDECSASQKVPRTELVSIAMTIAGRMSRLMPYLLHTDMKSAMQSDKPITAAERNDREMPTAIKTNTTAQSAYAMR